MPTKKKPIKRKRAAKKNAALKQLDQMRKTVKGMRVKLEREIKARKIEARVRSEAQKARAQLASQIAALRDQGRKLASELKSALTDAKRRDAARQQALDKIAELRAEYAKKSADLRAELSRATSDLGRKSEELKKLAGEAAHRAVGIIRGEESPAVPEASASAAPEPRPQAAATGPLSSGYEKEPDEEQ
jgi:chromosome segregation ATPase